MRSAAKACAGGSLRLAPHLYELQSCRAMCLIFEGRIREFHPSKGFIHLKGNLTFDYLNTITGGEKLAPVNDVASW